MARPRVRIERLFLRGFRNLEPTDLEPAPELNVLHGDNGAGKSSLLEAIAYLASLRSFRGARTEDLIQLGRDDAILKARVGAEPEARTIEVRLSRKGARAVRLDGKRPKTLAAVYGALQVVLFHPGDLLLGTGPADGRRAFLDRLLEQMEPAYGPTLARYTKALRSRNRLLKAEGVDRRSIRAFDEVLAGEGAAIGGARRRAVEALAPKVISAFEEITGETRPLAVTYRPRVEPTPDAIRRALDVSLEKDLARGFTAEGPHGDDLAFDVRDVAARHHASQGQHRAIVLALTVAELDVLTERIGRVPILLLDDVSSELDRARNRRFFAVLARLGGQVFLTTTHAEFILLEGNRADYRVEHGRITRV